MKIYLSEHRIDKIASRLGFGKKQKMGNTYSDYRFSKDDKALIFDYWHDGYEIKVLDYSVSERPQKDTALTSKAINLAKC